VTDLFRDILEGTVYLFAIKGLLGITVDPKYLVVIVITKKTIEYLIGWFDEKVGFWKFQNDYASRRINPFNAEILERIKNIESKLP